MVEGKPGKAANVLDTAGNRMGLGCFGMSHAYGHADAEESVLTIQAALDAGCRILDTADIYGHGENERLLGKAIRGRREQAVVCTKVGFLCDSSGKAFARCATPQHIARALEDSLRRLAVDQIDLYTLHRIDPNVALEETVGAMADLVQQGKVRAIGLSEVTPEQLRRANNVHPIAAVQSEYSMWTRGPEREVLPLCRDLGVCFVAFAPLGRGFFSGAVGGGTFGEGDFRRNLPRFAEEKLDHHKGLLNGLASMAERKQCTPAQLALSWLLHQGTDVFAIPGTRRRTHLEENLRAKEIVWTASELEEVDRLSAAHQDEEPRYAAGSLFAPG